MIEFIKGRFYPALLIMYLSIGFIYWAIFSLTQMDVRLIAIVIFAIANLALWHGLNSGKEVLFTISTGDIKNDGSASSLFVIWLSMVMHYFSIGFLFLI